MRGCPNWATTPWTSSPTVPWSASGGTDLDHADQTLQYEIAYWQEPKRCSLWEVDPEALAVEFVFDLPSRGDTCFPSILHEGGGTYVLCSSDPEGPELSWLEGQKGLTNIYRQALLFPE